MASGGSPESKLGITGKRLYEAVMSTYEDLEPHEREQLLSLCELRDMIANLQGLVDKNGLTETGAAGQVKLSSVISELRQSRVALSKLFADLALPADTDVVLPSPGASPTSKRASRAATARHNRDRRRQMKVVGDG